MYSVYKHTSPSGKVYIGITGKKPLARWKNGNGYMNNTHFWNAIVKYGWESFTHEIISEGLTKEAAATLEIHLIAQYDSTNPDNGYNKSTGGESGMIGYHHSEETREKIRKKAENMSEETRKKISVAKTGFHHSEETREKIRQARKQQPDPRKGRKHSEETRRKISAAKTGTVLSEQTRKRMSMARKGKPLSEKAIEKSIEAHKRSVICIETSEMFSSVNDAAKTVMVQRTGISAVCNGRQKTAGGYHWKYREG